MTEPSYDKQITNSRACSLYMLATENDILTCRRSSSGIGCLIRFASIWTHKQHVSVSSILKYKHKRLTFNFIDWCSIPDCDIYMSLDPYGEWCMHTCSIRRYYEFIYFVLLLFGFILKFVALICPFFTYKLN